MPTTLDNSDVRAVGVASALFDTTLVQGMQYVLSSNTNCWFKVTDSGGSASVGDGSHYLAAGQRAPISRKGSNNRVAIIRDAADGNASLSEVTGGQ